MPNDEGDLSDDGFETMLARLAPAAATADPVAAAYAAGRAAGRRGVNRWRGVAAVAAFGVAVVGHRGWSVPEQVAPRATAVVVGPPPPLFHAMGRPAELVRVEQALLDHGLDGLPPAPRRAVFPDRTPFF